jgi:drug/metabolite transporter (DMT)-like permease
LSSALAAVAALLWGCSDFFGGLAARGWAIERVGALGQLASCTVVGGILLLLPADPQAADFQLGIIAGISTACGVTMLYKALSIGPMHVVPPTTAVVAASLSVFIGWWIGERPSPPAAVGVALALVAVVLVACSAPGRHPAERPSRRVLILGAGAGLALGVLNACFAAAETASGLRVLGVSLFVALLLLAVAVLVVSQRPRAMTSGGRGWAIAAGVADIGATISIVLALQRGSLMVVGVLGTLFPVVTVLLARIVLGEVLGRAQVLGLACAVVALSLMVLP